MSDIEATPKQPKPPVRTLIPVVSFALLFFAAFGGFLFERDRRTKDVAAHQAEVLNLRAQIEGLKHQLHSVVFGPSSDVDVPLVTDANLNAIVFAEPLSTRRLVYFFHGKAVNPSTLNQRTLFKIMKDIYAKDARKSRILFARADVDDRSPAGGAAVWKGLMKTEPDNSPQLVMIWPDKRKFLQLPLPVFTEDTLVAAIEQNLEFKTKADPGRRTE